ncbi:phage protein Gp36 family protein [Chryseobacterium sp. KCF3-3]|uniref:phage protein Gp36 family protein n=1 Tax=Chryseobacterium sp. KCF3-3 TaxID=3231511 RepID=UPI0038B29BF3
MAFLTKDELITEAPKSFIDILVGTEQPMVDEVINDMIDLIKTNIGAYYDTDLIFSKQGEARSRTVLNYLKDLVFYKLQKRRKPGVLDPSDYDEAMKWLEEVSTGKRKADLPPKKIDTDGDGIPDKNVPFMKLGSNKSYPNGW